MYEYDAFISYSHASDGKLAPAVQSALEKFGSPWYRRSSVRVFRDQTGLGLTPDLWGDIQHRIERANCFILLAAPEAARSEWVEKEVQFWIQHRAGDPLLIVLTRGSLSWSEQQNDFDWTRTDALPRSLEQAFAHEPLWADLTWANSEGDLSLGKPRFFVEIAKVVAGMRGLPLDRVFNEASEQQRKAQRLFRFAVASLTVVTVLGLGAAIAGLRQWRTVQSLNAAEAERIEHAKTIEEERRRIASLVDRQRAAEAASVDLAAKAAARWPKDRELSTLLAIEASRIAHTPEAEHALRQTLLDPVQPAVLRGHSRPAIAAFCANGARVLTHSSDNTVRLWDVATAKCLQTFSSRGDPGDYAMGVASADGTTVLTFSGPRMFGQGYWESSTPLGLYDSNTGTLLTTIRDKFAARADLSPDATRIVVGNFNNSAKIWDADTGKVRFDLVGHDNRVTAAKFSPDGKWAVTTSYDGTARIWNASTGENVATLRGTIGLVLTDAIFSPDGEKILTLGGATVEKDDVLQLWDWVHSPGDSIANLQGHDGPINALVFSPDGRLVVTGGTNDQVARIWDASTGKCIHVLSGFGDFVSGVDVSPNGRWVVVASGDGTAKVWDAATGKELIPLAGENSSRTSAAFSPDGLHVVTGTVSGDVLVYTLPVLGSTEQLQMLALRRVKRALTPEERREYLVRQ